MTTFLPTTMSTILDTSRDFAHFKLPNAHVESVCAMRQAPYVTIATSDGNFYVYSIDTVSGGEGQLVKTFTCDDFDWLDFD